MIDAVVVPVAVVPTLFVTLHEMVTLPVVPGLKAMLSVPSTTMMPALLRSEHSCSNSLVFRKYIVHTGAMPGIRFEWDPAKAITNARKQGVTFEEAQTAFFDDLALIIADPDYSRNEARLVLLGFSAEARMLVVVHAYRSDPETIRIISARKATKAERVVYAKRHHP